MLWASPFVFLLYNLVKFLYYSSAFKFILAFIFKSFYNFKIHLKMSDQKQMFLNNKRPRDEEKESNVSIFFKGK